MRTPTRLYRIDDDQISYIRQLIAKDQVKLMDDRAAVSAADPSWRAADIQARLDLAMRLNITLRALM